VLVVIPAYNEAASVAHVIADVHRAVPWVDVLVVDDGSTDDTTKVARTAGALVARLPYNLGVGGAMRAGYRWAYRHGYTAVVQVDADGQHDPKYIPSLLQGLACSDVVIGSRFSGLGSYHVAGPRRWAILVLAFIMTRLIGVRLRDVTSGFRAAGPRAIAVYSQHFPTEYLGDTVETLVIARKCRLTVGQVPVEMYVRAAGRPSRGPWGSALDLARASAVIVLGLVRDWSIPGEAQI
jgi:glycosyltransferase involved in cell wall biosynthesis